MNPILIRDLLDIFEEDNLKKQVLDVVQSTDDPNLLQKVLDTLKAGNIEERIADVLSKDADANRFIDKLAEIIVMIKAPVEEKNAFLKEFPKGIVNTTLLLDGQQHTFSELVGSGFNTELFKILIRVMVSQGVGPGEVALAVLSPHVKWSGRAAGGGGHRHDQSAAVSSGASWETSAGARRWPLLETRLSCAPSARHAALVARRRRHNLQHPASRQPERSPAHHRAPLFAARL